MPDEPREVPETPNDPADEASNEGPDDDIPPTDDALKRLTALGAQRAFQLDPEVLQRVTAFQALDLSRFAPVHSFDFSSVALSNRTLSQLAAIVGKVPPIELPPSFWKTFEITRRSILDSVSVPSLYPSLSARDKAFKSSSPTHARRTRSPETFFSQHAVEITSVEQLLKTLSIIQSKQVRHRPIWRGQQDASWAVHSSLYRRLESSTVTEDRLVDAETRALELAEDWGVRTTHALKFLADLQHNGAPTRLMDVTTDPEIATWFAAEEHPDHEASDGMVIGWGRVPILKSGIASLSDSRPEEAPLPFWHAWSSDDDRRRVDWGTGTRTWTWFPPALNERMRAQRAGFLFEAGALLTDAIVEVFSDALDQDWRESEITRATSVVGLPARHDVLTKPNAANLVPMFVLRIAAQSKPSIRDYLKGKGLAAQTIYPDLSGLVSYLNGPFGPGDGAAGGSI
jgi:hypothetical protein